ncbi:helix-turn-helix transcriptional regulator [Aeromicrobium wangtongii]|uniref:helix-turn-helix transcriptional regulator n=1 Tax=Aeromicrobium wangtongii TaxID=2969247 RepID=UPI002017449A|nr:helix-turn-helix transcriptional regulator [Aeromicrobium wangtongii]MCL3820056.1 helix-turn-helix transcriptional regulator [Aeromicrobium wangtongii]
MASAALGDYLRARRAQISPDQIGVPTYGVRRVPGLRREEVAMTAGMSVDYYIRLEQGRETRPSPQVLDALGRVLQLDDDARVHLYRLAGLGPTLVRPSTPEQVDPELLRLMELWSHTPAIVLGRAYDILAGNALAYALFDGFRQGPNLMAKIFLDPDAATFYADWEDVARYTVAGFRLMQGRTPGEPRIQEVVERLSLESPDFVRMWERHEARGARLESKRFRHPQVGDLTLRINAFDVRSAPGQELVVYHAEPGSRSAEALARLEELAGTRTGD